MAANKLTSEEIDEIKYFYRLGATQRALAEQYGVSKGAVYNHTVNNEKRKAYRHRYYINESEHVKQQRKDWAKSANGKLSKYKNFIKHRYGLTFEDKQKMFESQDGLCAMCATTLKSVRLAHIDHSHITGKVRALLCTGCNTRLAVVENKEFCMKASLYLQRYNA